MAEKFEFYTKDECTKNDINMERSKTLVRHCNRYLYTLIQFSKSFIKALFKVAAIFPQGKGKRGSFSDPFVTSINFMV